MLRALGDFKRFSVQRRWLWPAVGTAVAVLAVAAWLSPLGDWLAGRQTASDAAPDRAAQIAAAAHTESVQISPQARKNIALKVEKVKLSSFERTIAIPGIVVERPGRSMVQVTAPLTGVVTRIDRVQGEAVAAGESLFEIRLTHEELVQAQGDFLHTAEELDVIAQEIQRLEKVTAQGAVAGKALLERQYDRQKQIAVQRAQHEALLLHGLSEAQIQEILDSRKLRQRLSVAAPRGPDNALAPSAGTGYQVQQLKVEIGQHVNTGDTLAVLADHSELLIEGSAFEKDLAALDRTLAEGWRVSAVLDADNGPPEVVGNLEVLYQHSQVDATTRAFHFYVRLPNRLLRESRLESGQRFVYWRFKPGQRLELRVPVERWENRIVLPVDALAKDGVETYVFQANGQRFERRPVHVEHRDRLWAVVANDGSLFAGDLVAVSGAEQLQLALKNAQQGGIDPHAGHQH